MTKYNTHRVYEGQPGSNGKKLLSTNHSVLVKDFKYSIQSELDCRHDLYKHSPDGFNWGYGGSGPSQLALALTADATGDDKLALQLYQKVKNNLVSKLPQGKPFLIDAEDVLHAAGLIPKPKRFGSLL